MFATGEIRYHDYFEFESHILLAEIGHYAVSYTHLDVYKRQRQVFFI